MKAPLLDDRTDGEASRAFAEHFGTRATQLPPLAIVIAAYNEEGAVGPVVAQALREQGVEVQSMPADSFFLKPMTSAIEAALAAR